MIEKVGGDDPPAGTDPPGETTCDQLPGAAPRSTTVIPSRSSRSLSRISSSLNAARDR